MFIQRFKKLKNGMYKIVCDGGELEVHEDLILKYDLLLRKNLEDEFLALLKKENQKYVVYDIALKELKKRLRSKQELRDILKKKDFDLDRIDEAILILEEQGYLDDHVYLDSYIHDRILLSLDGPLKIREGLLRVGLQGQVIDEKLSMFDENLEMERIRKIVLKYQKGNRKSVQGFRLKMNHILQQMGYHNIPIHTVLESIHFDDSALYQIEYDKLYRKLSSKYHGKELDYKIRQKLYQKGFRP